MGLLRLIGNILWFVLGGFFMGLAWWLVGLIAFISIVGIPWGRACFVIGSFSFWPFGREAVSRRELAGREDVGTGPLVHSVTLSGSFSSAGGSRSAIWPAPSPISLRL